jgi:hypothetical protein
VFKAFIKSTFGFERSKISLTLKPLNDMENAVGKVGFPLE